MKITGEAIEAMRRAVEEVFPVGRFTVSDEVALHILTKIAPVLGAEFGKTTAKTILAATALSDVIARERAAACDAMIEGLRVWTTSRAVWLSDEDAAIRRDDLLHELDRLHGQKALPHA